MWPIAIPVFLLGVAVGMGIGFLYFRHDFRELQDTRAQLEEAREFNKFCLDHASDVLTAWLDYKESHDPEE